MTPTEDWIAVLTDALAGRSIADGRVVLFASQTSPTITDPTTLAKFAAEHVEDLVTLTADPRDGLRHLALFALGFSADARSIDPLIDRLVDSMDHFDHDHCFEALGRLGDVALEPLFAIAAGTDEERSAEAVQALGQSRADSLPVLRRLLARPSIPPGIFSAIYNTHDPAALPDLEAGLWHPDPTHRSEALFTAYALLEIAREQAPEALAAVDIRRWGDRMVELAADEQVEDREVAWMSLGLLRDETHLPLLEQQLAAAEDEEDACSLVEAIGWMQTDRSRAWLKDRVADPKLGLASMAAVKLIEDPALPPGEHEPYLDVMRQMLLTDHGDHSWCAARKALANHATGRAHLFAYVADPSPERRRIACDSLIEEAIRHDAARLERWLAETTPSIAAQVRKAAETVDGSP